VVGILERTAPRTTASFRSSQETARDRGHQQNHDRRIKVKHDGDTAALERRLYQLPDVQVVSFSQVKQTIMKLIATARVMVLAIATIALLIAMAGVANTS